MGVLSRGKVAKKLADRAIDLMEGVQNLRKAIYPCVRFDLCHSFPGLIAAMMNESRYKLKVATSEKGSAREKKLMNMGVNYL